MPRFLCFGDSLTEGYTFQESGEFHPYSIALTLWRLISAKIRLLLYFYYRVNFRGKIHPSKLRRDKFTLRVSSKPIRVNLIVGSTFHPSKTFGLNFILQKCKGKFHPSRITSNTTGVKFTLQSCSIPRPSHPGNQIPRSPS